MTRSPERSEAAKAPSVKPCLTPMNLDKPSFRNKLQRGHKRILECTLHMSPSSGVERQIEHLDEDFTAVPKLALVALRLPCGCHVVHM